MTTAPPTLHQRVADVVLANAHDVDDARDLFEALGLVEPGGREILPDDTRPIPIFGDVGKAPGAKNPDASSPLAFADHGRRPEGMTTPPGLRDLPPLPVAPVRRRATRTSTPDCGTRAGYNAHRRRGEDPCTPCQEFMTGYWRERDAARRKKAKPPEPVTETDRLIAAGVNPETAAILGDRAAS